MGTVVYPFLALFEKLRMAVGVIDEYLVGVKRGQRCKTTSKGICLKTFGAMITILPEGKEKNNILVCRQLQIY